MAASPSSAARKMPEDLSYAADRATAMHGPLATSGLVRPPSDTHTHTLSTEAKDAALTLDMCGVGVCK
eukprot:COSAG06_NODE_43932_length_367_cov_2.111940_1_plen_67_part_10